MRFVFETGGVERDLELRAGRPGAIVADLAAALGIGGGSATGGGLVIDGRVCGPQTPLGESGLVRGSRVRAPAGGWSPAAAEPSHAAEHAPFVLRVVGGLDAGTSRPLPVGRLVLGRDRDNLGGISLSSPLVSQAHCVLDVKADGTVTVADLGSANGTDLDGVRLRGPHRVGPDDLIGLGGGAVVRILPVDRIGPRRHVNPVREAQPGGTLPFTRAPRPATPPGPPPVPLPAAPAQLGKTPFSISMMIGPVIMAAGIVALTHDLAFAAFAALSPIMFLTNWIEERSRGRFSLKRGKREYAAALARAGAELSARATRERHARLEAVVDPCEALDPATGPALRLWERRPGAEDFLRVSIGLADLPWPPPVAAEADPGPQALAVAMAAARLRQVPVTVQIGAGDVVGLQGDRAAAVRVARSLICQAVAGSGPADVVLAVFADADRVADWDWTKWLPHGADRRSGSARHVAVGQEEALALARALTAARPAEDGDTAGPAWSVRLAPAAVAGQAGPTGPVVLAVVDGRALLEGRPNPLRELLAGATVPCGGVVLTERLPALCTSVVTVGGTGAARLERVTTGETVPDILAGGYGTAAARRLAVGLARFEDPELRVAGAGLPDRLTLLPLLSLAAVSGPAVAERWRTGAETLRVRAVLGVGERDVFTVDLDDDGPHGLIAGTTGSGKSELLRTLIASLAVEAGPEHLTFVLVDYKGGGALDECARLPQVVGLVTDLDQHLGERALRCLEAELRHREHLLRGVGLGHIREYQRLRDTERPDLAPMPRLVLVIDEFATLVKALPEFVDALVSIAQRGRSLGMHLIMATQRPAGSVNDAIKNNVKLRIALRLESAADSEDVIDSNAAAGIGTRQWGRAYFRVSAKEVLPIQTALSTGVTSRAGEHAPAAVAPFFLGMSAVEQTAADGPTDLQRLVAAARDAQEHSGIADPRRPWPDMLAAEIPLEPGRGAIGIQSRATGVAALALADDPDRQRQYPVGWDPADGNVLIYGSVGSGTTSALFALAAAQAAAGAPDRLHLYVIDMGAGDLAPLRDLPHTGAHVGAGEEERRRRLLRLLRRELDERKAAGARGRPDWLVVIDVVGALVSAYDRDVAGMDILDDLARVYADGPAVGIRFAVGADRSGAVPHSWSATTRQKILMRLADPNDYANFDVKPQHVPAFVPGRAVVAATRQVIQIGWIGADPADLIAEVAAAWPDAVRSAPTVGALPARVSARRLGAARVDTEPWWFPLGVADSTLEPIGVELYAHEHLLIAGPQRSGRSQALCSIARSVLAAADPPAVLALTPRRSPLSQIRGLTRLAARSAELAGDLDAALAENGGRRTLLLVDDAETVEEDPGPIYDWLGAAGPGCHVVAAGRAEAIRKAYGHWTHKVKESRTGLLLVPDHALDGDLLGLNLPRAGQLAPVPGRGYLIANGTLEGVQLALDDSAPAAGTTQVHPDRVGSDH